MIVRLATLLIVIAGCLAVFAQEPKPDWGYAGATGPENWSNLNRSYHRCKYGHNQSPIDIWGAAQMALPNIRFDYKEIPLRIIDNGHTIQINYRPGSWITVGDKRYELRQFHFHHPSEEHISGKGYDMTVHLVHADSKGKLAVVAVLLTSGGANAEIQKIWDHLPSAKGREQEIPIVTVDAAALLPSATGYYTYMGSLTTPPCTEDVTWFVLKTPVEISGEQVARFAKLYPNNARPLEPTGLRTVSQSEF